MARLTESYGDFAYSNGPCRSSGNRYRSYPIYRRYRSYRSRFMTLSHAATKSRTNFSPASSLA
jgi:hypothetical protein